MVWPFDCYNITNRRKKKTGGRSYLFLFYGTVWSSPSSSFGSGLDPSTPIGTLLVFLSVCVCVSPPCFSPWRREEEKSLVKHKRVRPFFFFFPNGHHSLFFSPPPYSTWTPNVNPVVHIKMYGSFLLGLFVAFRTLSSRTKVNTFVGMNLTRLCVRAPRIGPTQKGPLGSTLIRWGPEVEKKGGAKRSNS